MYSILQKTTVKTNDHLQLQLPNQLQSTIF